MAYLEELLPEFRNGAKIRLRTWPRNQYIYFSDYNIFGENNKLVTLSGNQVYSNRWELYQEPIDWDYIIKNKCLCWFWDDDDGEPTFSYTLEEIKDFDSDGFIYKSTKDAFWQNCRPVRRDEVNFYEERKDD